MESSTSQGLVSREVRGQADAPDAIDQAIEAASGSWQGQRGTSIAGAPAARCHDFELALGLTRNTRLGLWLLTCQQQPVAFLFFLLDGNRLFALKTGFDRSQRPAGPGVLVRGCAMRGLAAWGVVSRELLHPASSDERRSVSRLAPHDGISIFARPYGSGRLRAGEQVRRLVHGVGTRPTVAARPACRR